MSQINNCKPQLPTFLLNKAITIKFGTNINNSLSFVPYEHWQNSKFIIRVWLNDPNTDSFWTQPSWILVDQLSSSVQISFAAISLAGKYTLTFQSQLIVDPNDFIDASFYTSTELLMFDLDNQNWELVSSLTGWYAVYGLSKNYTVLFSDLENDEVKIVIIKDGGLDIFVQSINNTSFEFDIQSKNTTIKSAQISFNYTDKYHTGPDSWTTARVILNVFNSEPPRYANEIQDIVLNSCNPQKYVQELPSVIDSDSILFTSSFANGTFGWIRIVENKQVIVKFSFFQLISFNF